MIDLRSDTVTRPTAAMREAMLLASVGDDVFAEDPTVNALQERVAALLGHEAALFVPSGTMANQIALQLHARAGEEVLVADGAHCLWYESGAASAIAGVQLVSIGREGAVTPSDIAAAMRPSVDWCPRTAAVVLENTHNRAGGRVIGVESVATAVRAAHDAGLTVHLDGARLFNAAVRLGAAPRAVVAGADTVCVCLSKGLGAPVGSVLAGSASRIRDARRLRKRMGGGMRQVGLLAAAGLYALDHHVQRLVEDHDAATDFAAVMARAPGVAVVPPDTNIVMVDLVDDVGRTAASVVERSRERGVLMSAFGPRRVRVVTHLDVSRSQVLVAAATLADVLRGPA